MQYRYNQSEVELRHYKEAYERGYLKTNFLYKGNSAQNSFFQLLQELLFHPTLCHPTRKPDISHVAWFLSLYLLNLVRLLILNYV